MSKFWLYIHVNDALTTGLISLVVFTVLLLVKKYNIIRKGVSKLLILFVFLLGANQLVLYSVTVLLGVDKLDMINANTSIAYFLVSVVSLTESIIIEKLLISKK